MSAERNAPGTAAAAHSIEQHEGHSFTGGCACGKIRYEFSTAPLLSFNCHCRTCQRVGGGAFASIMIVPKADFKLLQGEPRYYASPANSGYFLQRGFCPECGSQVLALEDHRPLLVLIHAGSLDDPSWHRPAVDIFSTRAQPWAHVNPELPKIPEMPPLPDNELFRIRAT